MSKIYLAGPLFTAAERLFNAALAIELRQLGHEVWLPQANEPRDKTPAAIFANDVDGIDWCDVVVACMDGPDPDSGTSWECGYAYGRKPAVLFRTDARAATDAGAPFNLMMATSAAAVIEAPATSWDMPALAAKIHQHLVILETAKRYTPRTSTRLSGDNDPDGWAAAAHYGRDDVRGRS